MDPHLTPQDYRALSMLGAGHSVVETAATLDLSMAVLSERLVHLRHVLGVSSTVAAIDVALGRTSGETDR